MRRRAEATKVQWPGGQRWSAREPAFELHALADGAIFGFAANGTNPDLLLGIELHGEGLSDSAWKFGLARMTLAQLTVRLDGKEVW